MLYKSDYIYTKLKTETPIESEREFLDLIGSSSIAEEDLLSAFADLRLKLGENFKLDNICLLVGNGCSIYAGSKSTTEFNLNNVIKGDEYKDVQSVLDNIAGLEMEPLLNALITIKDYYNLVNDTLKEESIKRLIEVIKNNLLSVFVNSMDYSKLKWHEIFILKLRAFGCLQKIKIYTTNYDLAFEYVLDKLSIEYENGFTGFVNRHFNPKSLQSSNKTELIKVHGSINWIYDKIERVIKEYQPRFKDGRVMIDDSEQVLIYPTAEKLYQTYNEPYSELMRGMLNTFETKRNVIIVVGYKYEDEHINDILYKAVANPNNIFYFFDYDASGCEFISKMEELSKDVQNINILYGKFLASFDTFVRYMVPATPEKTDQEKALELLQKVLNEYAK